MLHRWRLLPSIGIATIYCVEFLEEMIRFNGKDDNILVQNQFVLLSSVEMVAVSRLWSIIHFAIIMPMRWLAGKTHELAEFKWGPISMNRVLDHLLADVRSIADEPQLIHDETFMMGMMDKWKEQLPPFKEYMKHQFEDKTTKLFGDSSGTKAVPFHEVRKELFHPTDQDNKDSTPMLEELAVIACKAWVEDMLDEKKATYLCLSVSGSEISWDHCPDEVKEALYGHRATNDLAESCFAGLTRQIEIGNRILMTNAAAISDMKRNGFMNRGGKKKGDTRGKFYELPEELQITAVMAAMENASATRESNNHALNRMREYRQQKEDALKEVNLEKATTEYIGNLIYHAMNKSDRYCSTKNEMNDMLRSLQYKKDKEALIKDNINIRWRGFGWSEWATTWSKDGRGKTIQQLKSHFFELLDKENRDIPDKPAPGIPLRKDMPIVGQLTSKVKDLDSKAMESNYEFDQKARKRWRDMNARGEGDILAEMQTIGKRRKLDDSFIGERIELLSQYEDNDGNVMGKDWSVGVVKDVCDGTYPKWRKRNQGPRGRQVYKEGEAAEVEWDAVGQLEAVTTIEEFKHTKWNGQDVGAWRLWQPDFDYGID